MSLDKALKNLKYDVRMLELQFKQGSITEAEYKQYLSQLSDCSNNSEKLDLEKTHADDQQH